MLDNAPDEEPWLTQAQQVFEDGRAAVARREFFQGSPAEIVARARARVESRTKPA